MAARCQEVSRNVYSGRWRGSLPGEQGELFGPPLRHIKPSIHAGWVSEQLWKPVKPVNAEGLSLNNNQKKKNSVQGDWIRLPQEWPLPVAPSRLRHTTTGAFFFFFSLYFSFLSTIFSLKRDQGTKQENDMTEEMKKKNTRREKPNRVKNKTLDMPVNIGVTLCQLRLNPMLLAEHPKWRGDLNLLT